MNSSLRPLVLNYRPGLRIWSSSARIQLSFTSVHFRDLHRHFRTGKSHSNPLVSAGNMERDAMSIAKGTAWEKPKDSEFNFQSDTSTVPTAAMLQSIVQTTLGDDVLREDSTTNALEAWMAELLPTYSTTSASPGGLLVLSGTMGNQVSIRTHLNSPPHSVLADARAHVLEHEAGAMSMLSQAFPIHITPSNSTHLTLQDIQHHAILDDNIHHAPTRLICLENTLGGAILPLAEVQAITSWARSKGIATHLDGARLWDAVSALCAEGEFDGDLRKGLKAYSSCFDSVTVCFSKGLGAPIGSAVVGSEAFIKKARHVRKMLGGGTRMSGIIAGPAIVAVQETFFGKKLTRAHLLAKKVEQGWAKLGGRVVGQTPQNEGGKRDVADGQKNDEQNVISTNIVWLDVKGSGVPVGLMAKEAEKENLLGYWKGDVARVVCHYQTADEAVDRLLKLFERVLAQRKEGVNGQQAESVGTAFQYGEASR